MTFCNTCSNAEYAEAYSFLEFAGTYGLAFRDLPAIIGEHVVGKRAVDFGCGAGRSSRFLKKLGFEVVGIDISSDMIRKARAVDPAGDYRLIEPANFTTLDTAAADLVLAAFTFDNIPTLETKVANFRGLKDLLEPEGKIVVLVSSPEMYTHEWASFSTKDFPENRYAKSGDRVKIIITAIPDSRPVTDILWTDESYREVFQKARLEVVQTYKPLARSNEPATWVNETRIAPWVIYVGESIKGADR